MIHVDIKHVRLPKYKDPYNSFVAIRIKDGSNKWIYLLGVYRQWKKKGEFNANDAKSIKRKICQFKTQCSSITQMFRKNKKCILARYFNLDRCKHNDLYMRPQLKA